MVFAHGFGEKIGFGGQAADVDVHNAFRKLFVFQSTWAVAVVLVEQRPDLVVLEHASELVQSFLEFLELYFAVVVQVEVSQSLFGGFPFVRLSVWLFSDLFINNFFQLFESLRGNVVLGFGEIPSANQDVLKILEINSKLLFIFPVGYRSSVQRSSQWRLLSRRHLVWTCGPFLAWRFLGSPLATRSEWSLWGACWRRIMCWGGPEWPHVGLGTGSAFRRLGSAGLQCFLKLSTWCLRGNLCNGFALWFNRRLRSRFWFTGWSGKCRLCCRKGWRNVGWGFQSIRGRIAGWIGRGRGSFLRLCRTFAAWLCCRFGWVCFSSPFFLMLKNRVLCL